ncbi:MAG TPA: OsmC family protein [Longimicrobiaceae bacterium]
MTTTAVTGHSYAARITWTGNRGSGTESYFAYDREYVVEIEGKPTIAGSANPAFRGRPERHDPEDLFVAAVASCHMLSYLSLCAREGVRVTAYQDNARATLMLEAGGGGRFSAIVLRPVVTVADAQSVRRAQALTRLHTSGASSLPRVAFPSGSRRRSG